MQDRSVPPVECVFPLTLTSSHKLRESSLWLPSPLPLGIADLHIPAQTVSQKWTLYGLIACQQ